MADFFQTGKDDPRGRQLGNLGTLLPNGGNQLSVDDLAARGLNELQQKGDEGEHILDEDGKTIPLEGKALRAAAKDFAESRGFKIVRGRRPDGEADSDEETETETQDPEEPVEHVRDPETGVTVPKEEVG